MFENNRDILIYFALWVYRWKESRYIRTYKWRYGNELRKIWGAECVPDSLHRNQMEIALGHGCVCRKH